MNVFRLVGDFTHLVAIIFLLVIIWKSRSSKGISGKSQILLALVYTTRYLDLLTTYISAYNSAMKMVFILISFATVCSIYIIFRDSHDRHLDTFRIEYLITAVFILALFYNHSLQTLELMWTFSIYLEAVAIWPQLFMIKETRKVHIAAFIYMLALGTYRTFYVLNWVYRYYTQGFYDQIAFMGGVFQTIPYFIFFILCLTKVVRITNEETSWYSKNLSEANGKDNGLFVIKLGEEPLIPNEEIKESLVPDTNHLQYFNLDTNSNKNAGDITKVHSATLTGGVANPGFQN